MSNRKIVWQKKNLQISRNYKIYNNFLGKQAF